MGRRSIASARARVHTNCLKDCFVAKMVRGRICVKSLDSIMSEVLYKKNGRRIRKSHFRRRFIETKFFTSTQLASQPDQPDQPSRPPACLGKLVHMRGGGGSFTRFWPKFHPFCPESGSAFSKEIVKCSAKKWHYIAAREILHEKTLVLYSSARHTRQELVLYSSARNSRRKYWYYLAACEILNENIGIKQQRAK